MSADFLLTSCPAPLAHITYAAPGNSSATSATYLEIAPENVWREPFCNWLTQPDTINHIFDEIDPYILHVDSWVELIEQRVADTPIANDPNFQNYLDTLADDLTIRDADTNAYAQRVIREIADTFLEAANSAFITYISQGAIHNWEYVTAGLSFGDAPTDHFDDVALLSWLDFFCDFPIADIDANGNITNWRDRNGNIIAAPQITSATNTTNTDKDN